MDVLYYFAQLVNLPIVVGKRNNRLEHSFIIDEVSKGLTFPGLKLQDLFLLYIQRHRYGSSRLQGVWSGVHRPVHTILFHKASFKDEAPSANTGAYYSPRSVHRFPV